MPIRRCAAMRESLALATAAIARLPRDSRTLVAVDGIDGAGKTTFADALATQPINRVLVRASGDDFHNPSAIRYRRGRQSPEGFYLDSFDIRALTELLLKPFAAGRPFRCASFDLQADSPVAAESVDAPADAVLILDGLFLHRAELRDWWDLSILLDVSPAVAAQRLRHRDGKPVRHRYVRGQQLYFAEADPAKAASLVLRW